MIKETILKPQELVIDLEILCNLVNLNTCVTCEIQTVWIDLGTNWSDKTLVTVENNPHGSYQMLSPYDVSSIKKGEFTIANAIRIINTINKRGW